MKQKGVKNKDFRGILIQYPASGFQNDAVRLLQKFVATRSIRFEEFIRVWKASNFTLVTLGRVGIREQREFLEEAFKILLKYIMPPYNLQVRVGGIYTIYSMYHTQRLKCKRRIRVPLSCWPDFCQLQEEVLEQRHLDAAYIIRKLIGDRAFMICAYPSMLSVDEVYTHEGVDGNPTGELATTHSGGLGEATGLLAQVQDEDNIGQLHAVHEKYHHLKCKFNFERGGQVDRPSDSVNLIKPDITQTILNIINPPTTPTVPQKTSATQESGHSSERAEKLKLIKEGALGSAIKPYRSLAAGANKRSEVEGVTDVTKTAFPPRKRGRPLTKPPEGVKIPEPATSSSEEERNTATDASGLPLEKSSGLPLEKSKPRKTTKKANLEKEDDDYQPTMEVDLTGTPARRLPKRRSKSKSTEGEEEVGKSSLKKKRKRSASGSRLKQDSSKEISPGAFVAIRPDKRNPDQPMIGRVVAVKNQSTIEVVIYRGNFDTTWIPITTMSEDETEGKPVVEIVKKDDVIMRGLTLTKGNKLQEKVKEELKKAIENVLQEK